MAILKQFVKDYLQFSKKDRIAVLVLVSLIFIVILLPYIWPVAKPPKPSPEKIAGIKAQLAALNKSNGNHISPANDEEAAVHYYNGKEPVAATNYKLFYFDPNTLDIPGWQQLGIREKTAATIVKYISKGGKFRRPEDIRRIYGLNEKDYVRLSPFVKIAVAPVRQAEERMDGKKYAEGGKPIYAIKKAPVVVTIDINTADTAAFIALPGIGSKLAARIITFREKLGGFYSVKQISDTYGLPDSTFIKIQPMLQCGQAAVRQIDVNNADANTLKQHPYIRWNIANAIIRYRAQHGNFRSIEDLQQIALITPEIFEKLKVYLVIGQ